MAFRARHLLGIEHLAPLEITTVLDLADRYVDLNRRTVKQSDVLAGLTVAIVALPLSMAIAIASGADPATGLVTAVVGGLLISLLGGSRVQIGGPTAAFIPIILLIIEKHGYAGLLMATVMAGVILVVMGLHRGSTAEVSRLVAAHLAVRAALHATSSSPRAKGAQLTKVARM